jgi:uncharacterized membrane protein
MTQKCFWRELLIVVLSVALAMPARADNPEKVLIVIAATTTAAAIAVVATVASVHRRKKIVITGCVISGEKGMTVTDEEDKKTYALFGDTTDLKRGDRMRLEGKKVKPKGPDKTFVWEAKDVIKDFGVCPP